jgi:hypothetical protein
VRAGLISVVLFGQLADAIPLPTLSKRDLRHPVAQQEATRWTQRLNDWGVEITRDELIDRGLAVGNAANGFRKAVLRPWYPLRRATGTGQSWGLFAFPEPHAGRLVVRGRALEGDWETLFSAPNGDGRLGELLRFRRVRGIYDDAADRPKPGTLWPRFSRWVAAEVLAERPDFDEVEVRVDLIHVVPPGGGPADPDRVYHARLELRSELAAGAAASP